MLLQVGREGGHLQFLVIDRGPGFTAASSDARLGKSQKQTGLGLGLTLTVATAERLGGEVTTRNTEDGAVVCLRLPLSAISPR